jgi:hypothetical protein
VLLSLSVVAVVPIHSSCTPLTRPTKLVVNDTLRSAFSKKSDDPLKGDQIDFPLEVLAGASAGMSQVKREHHNTALRLASSVLLN